MGTSLKFEFDFDEVSEGIKQGVIRELSETNFDEAKESAINQIKGEIKRRIELTYSDEYSLKNEIKNEIKEKVFEELIKEANDKYLDQFNEYVQSQLKKNPDRLEQLKREIKDTVSENLYDDLFSSIRGEVVGQVKETTAQLCNLIGGNGINIEDSGRTISKKEYEELLDRDRKLSALEAGGVDNWEWYEESLNQYYDGEE